MKTLSLDLGRAKSRIMIGQRLHELHGYLPAGKTVIVTDENVLGLHGASFPPGGIITIGSGEENKTLKAVENIHRRLLELEADRSAFIVGIGGGVVCDITGFAASTYMRGVKFGFAATTLLAQVDAAIGGKNGVNIDGYKNTAGLFRQPAFVVCDLEVLSTLPGQELTNGFAEAIKSALVGDPELFEFLEVNRDRALSLDPSVVERIVERSVAVKITIVKEDEQEQNYRKVLNLGHTLGHAVERVMDIPHGFAVSMGMAAAAHISVAKSLLSRGDRSRILSLLARYGLPVDDRWEVEKVIDTMKKDKKRRGDSLDFVLLKGIGQPVIMSIHIDELEAAINDMREHR